MEKPHWLRHVITFALIFALGGFMFMRGGCPHQQGGPAGYLPDDVRVETIEVAGWPLHVEVADTPDLHRRGLRGRKELIPGYGILFVFREVSRPEFTAEDIHIPLSLAFISEDGVIEDIRDVAPNDLRKVGAGTPVKYVLGVRQGFFDDHGIETGAGAELPESVR